MEFQYDLPRAVRFIVYSTFIGTPLAHLWFGFLDEVGHVNMKAKIRSQNSRHNLSGAKFADGTEPDLLSSRPLHLADSPEYLFWVSAF